MVDVLGIDAAWTKKEPSRVALLEGSPGDWRCVAVAAPRCPGGSTYLNRLYGASDYSHKNPTEATTDDGTRKKLSRRE